MSKQEKLFPKIEKSLMRDLTNHSKNKLADRLYRNSSLNHLNPNTTLLSSSAQQFQSSILNSSASNSCLIAAISLRKLKKKCDNTPYLEISNGKLLINKNQTQLYQSVQKESPKNKKLFKKLQKINYEPINKILPDDLINFPIQIDSRQQKKIVKKTIASPCKYKKNLQNHKKQDLLPQDFIQLLQSQKNITNEFCYLKKKEHPYDLKIIQFNESLQRKSENMPIIYPNEYITISSRGISYFSQNQPRFVSLQQWKRQATFFSRIIKLNFFKNFKLIKNFGNWKKYLRKSAMKSTIENLKQKFVYNDIFLSKSLVQVRRICYDMETDVSYCRLDDCQKVTDLKQFRNNHEIFLVNYFERKIQSIEQDIKEIVINNMALSMKEFKQKNKISSSVQGKGMPLLIGDQKNLQMPYTKQATLRTQQQKFQKFIKLIDLIITHSKVNMMQESTILLAEKIRQQNECYQKQVVQLNYKNNYKGKQYLQCILTLYPNGNGLFLKPTKQDLKSLFQDIVSRSVVRICRYHKKISSDIDVLSIIYDSQEQFPKQLESQSLKAIMTSQNRQQQMLALLMSQISISYKYIESYIERFRSLSKIHSQNLQKLHQIQTLQTKDYEIIRNYLQKWQKQKDLISQISNEHQGPIFQLCLKQIKQQNQMVIDECVKKIKAQIPKKYEQSIIELNKNLNIAKSKFQQKRTQIKQLMEFSNYRQTFSNQIQIYSESMSQISCLEIIMKNISEATFKKFEKETRQLQASLGKLRLKLGEAAKQSKKFEDKAREDVKKMAPKNKQKIADLYLDLSREKSCPKSMENFIRRKRVQLEQIKQQFRDIKSYQIFLSLEQSDESQIKKFQQFFNILQKIWSITHQYEQFFEQLSQKLCFNIKSSQIYSKLEQLITNAIELDKQVKLNKKNDQIFQFSSHDEFALKQMLEKIQNLRPTIQTIECLYEKSICQKQFKQVKLALQQKNQKLFRIIESGKTTKKVKDMIEASAASQLQLFKIIAAKSKKNIEITQKLEEVKSFTNFSKQNVGILRNLCENFKLHIKDFLNTLDEKIILVNFIIQQSEHAEKQKAKIEKNTLHKLKQILLLWNQYQEYVQYFEPIYDLTDWKNTQQGKIFMAATDQNWKKTLRNFKQSNLIKFIASDRVIPTLKESNSLLQSLYSSINTYFNSKRLQNSRFSFLSNNQILRIHSESKDFRGFNKYINLIFPSIKELSIKQQETTPHEAVSFDNEVLQLRLNRISNFQVQQMVKVLDEGIKNNIKLNIKNCHNSYDSQEFNKNVWIKQNLLQSLIFISNVYFSRIIEQDYLCADGDDIEKLYNYHLTQIQQFKLILKQETGNPQFFKKYLILLTQTLGFRDILLTIISQNVITKESYTWLKQVRSYYNTDQAYIQYLNLPISYGNQFVCFFDNPILTINLNEKAIIELVNTMMTCGNVPIVQKSYLSQICNYNAKPYYRACLATGNQLNYLESLIQGAWLSGSFVDIQLSNQINMEQVKILATKIQQIQLALGLKEPFLRGYRNMIVNRQAGISIMCSQFSSPQILKYSKFQYRILKHQQISWQTYLDLLFELYQVNLPNLSKKLSKILMYLQKSIKNLYKLRQQIKIFIQQTLIQRLQNQDQNNFLKMLLKVIFKKQFSQGQHNFIQKIFYDAFGVHLQKKIFTLKYSNKQNLTNQHQILKLIQTLKQNKIIILLGQNYQYKEMIANALQKIYCVNQHINENIFISQKNTHVLFGKYLNGKWVDGVLTLGLKQYNRQKKCIVIIGKCWKIFLKNLEKLNSPSNSNNFINLQNGQILRISAYHKIIFLAQNQSQDSIFANSSIETFDSETFKITPEYIFCYMTTQKVFKSPSKALTLQQKHFNCHSQNLQNIQNLFLNNLDKIGHSSLKLIGYFSQYNEISLIMKRFVILINSVLTKDKEKYCVNSIKLIQKLYIWCLFWSISSSLPIKAIEKLDKIVDSIKIQYDRSRSLSDSKLVIYQRNQTLWKFIKDSKVYKRNQNQYFLLSSEMQAKTQLLKLLIIQNNNIIFLGQKNSGKTRYIQYLQETLSQEGNFVINTKLTSVTTLQQFLQLIKKGTTIQNYPNNHIHKYKIRSRNGKKCIIFVDNLNLINTSSQLFQFFQCATNNHYYYDANKNFSVSLTDICFIFSVNGSFQALEHRHHYIRKLFPIYINQPELFDIIDLYSNKIQCSLELDKKQIVIKLMQVIVSLYSFCKNLIKKANKRYLGYYIPLCIAKQIIQYSIESQTTINQIISLFKYLSIKKYIESGLFKQFEVAIKNQLQNLLSLVVKNYVQPQKFLQQQTTITNQLYNKYPLLGLSMNYQYYRYLAYLIKKTQTTNHLISHSILTSPTLKQKAISQICFGLQLNYHYLANQNQLKKIGKYQKMVCYINPEDQTLINSALAVISQLNSSRSIKFIIDIKNIQQLEKYIRKYPQIQDLAHIYDPQLNNCVQTSRIQHFRQKSQFLEELGYSYRSKEFKQFFYYLDCLTKNSNSSLHEKLDKRLLKLQAMVQNYKYFEQEMSGRQKQIIELQQSIKQMNNLQQSLQTQKNYSIYNISSQNNRQTSKKVNQKQPKSNNLQQIAIQLKKLKTHINEQIGKSQKIKQLISQKLFIWQTFKTQKFKIFTQYQICKILSNNQSAAITFQLINGALTNLSKSKLNKQQFQIIFNMKINGFSLNQIYSALLNVEIKSCNHQLYIIKWIYSNYQTIFVTSNFESLQNKLQLVCPETKVCQSQSQFSQHTRAKPVLTKQIQNFGTNQVSVICKQIPENRLYVSYEISNEQSNRIFLQKIEQVIIKIVGIQNNCEKLVIEAELKRFQIQHKSLKIKLYQKFECPKIKLFNQNTLSCLKQIAQSIIALKNRIQASKIKLQAIQNKIQSKYGQILNYCANIRQYLLQITKQYSYTNINDSNLFKLVKLSLVVRQNLIEEQIAESKNTTIINKQLILNETKLKLIQNICKYVTLILNPIHSIQACLKLAKLQLKFKQSYAQDAQQKILLEEQYRKICSPIPQQAENRLWLMLSLAQQILELDIRRMLDKKQQWLTQIYKLFQQNKQQDIKTQQVQWEKLFIIVESLLYNQYNTFKLVDRQIRKYLSNDQALVYLSDQQSIDRGIQILQKSSNNHQGWMILKFNGNLEKTNKLIDFIMKSKGYKAVILFQKTEQLANIKKSLITNKYYEACLHDHTVSISYQILQLIKKFEIQNISNETIKLLKMMEADLISQLCKGLIDPKCKITNFSYKILRLLSKKILKITAKDVAQIAFDYYYDMYDDKARLFIKQAKKLTKLSWLPQVYDDGSISEIYTFFNQNFETIKVKIEKQDRLKQTLDKLLPHYLIDKLQTDSLLGLKPFSINKQSTKNKKLSYKSVQMLDRLNFIIQQSPILNKLQQKDKNSLLYIQILKSNKKYLQKLYFYGISRIKKYKYIIEQNKYLSQQTQKQIISTICDKKQTVKKFQTIYQHIILLQKNIQLKQNLDLSKCLQLVNEPRQFLYTYIYNIFQGRNLSKIDWAEFGFHIRCLTDKQKDSKELNHKNQYFHFPNLKLINGQFENHKFYIQSTIQGQDSNLPNVYINIGRDQHQLLGRSIPLIINQINTAQILVTSKAKELGFWGCKTYATISNQL